MAKVSFAAFQRRYEESQTRPTYSGGGDYYKPTAAPLGQPPRRNVVRLMEPHDNMLDANGEPDPIVIAKTHYGMGPNKDVIGPCLGFFNLPCPACNWVDELFARGKTDKAMRDLAFRIRSKVQFYANAVDILSPAVGVQTWRFGPEMEKSVRAAFFDDAVPPVWRDITDRDTGRNLIMDVGTKPGKMPGETFPDYRVVKAADTPSAIDPTWLTQIRDLTQEVWQPTPAQLLAGLRDGTPIRRVASATVISVPAASVPVPGAAPLAAPVPIAATATVVPQTAAASAAATMATPAEAPARRTRVKPPAAAPATAPAPATRQPMGAAAASAPAADPLEAAYAEVLRLGAAVGFSTPTRISKEELEAEGEKPGCYGRDQDVADKFCQECSAILWCRATIMGLVAA